MPHSDWFPRREQEMADLCQKWMVIIGKDENVINCNWDTAECTTLITRLNTFLAARAAFTAEDSSAKRRAKNAARKAAEAAMRDFANTSVRFNKQASEAVKRALALKARDAIHTPHPIPAGQPETVVENTRNHYEHKVIALNPNGKTTSKPADADGVTYAWQVGGEKPAAADDLPRSKFSRRTNWTVTHTEVHKGKVAYYAARYENSKGEGGPWSPIVDAFIG